MATDKEVTSGLTTERLKQLLNYDSRSGLFTWEIKASSRAMPGGRAGTVRTDGYLEIQIDGTRFMAHRLAWFYMNGTWPREFLDHINRNRSDNTYANLRECSASQNQYNRPTNRNNSTGLKGVTFKKKENVWVAKIGIDGKSHRIGQYLTAEAAHEAYRRKANELFGEFSSGG